MRLKLTLVSISVMVSLIAACAGIIRPPKPASDAEFTKVILRRVIVPAFSDEATNKWVRVTVRFLVESPKHEDLPDTYQKDWIRFVARDSAAQTVISKNFMVLREKGDMVSGLWLSEYIDALAFCVPVTTRNIKTGKTKKEILFEVSKIERIGRRSPVEKPPPRVRNPFRRGR